MSLDFFVDVLWLVPAVPTVLLMVYARARVQTTYSRYRAQRSACGLSGAQAARLMLDSVDLRHVSIEEADGELTDHYDQRRRVIRLSGPVLREPSITALGMAAHEVGHAIQHHAAYRRYRLRAWVIPVATYAPPLGLLLIVLSILLRTGEPAWAGTVLLTAAATLALLVLPVERDASRRGLELLVANGLDRPADSEGAFAVLDAARLAYLALLLASARQAVSMGLIASGVGRRRDRAETGEPPPRARAPTRGPGSRAR